MKLYNNLFALTGTIAILVLEVILFSLFPFPFMHSKTVMFYFHHFQYLLETFKPAALIGLSFIILYAFLYLWSWTYNKLSSQQSESLRTIHPNRFRKGALVAYIIVYFAILLTPILLWPFKLTENIVKLMNFICSTFYSIDAIAKAIYVLIIINIAVYIWAWIYNKIVNKYKEWPVKKLLPHGFAIGGGTSEIIIIASIDIVLYSINYFEDTGIPMITHIIATLSFFLITFIIVWIWAHLYNGFSNGKLPIK